MFERFLSCHAVTGRSLPGSDAVSARVPVDAEAFMQQFAGCTFDNGLYRVNTLAVAESAAEWCGGLVPALSGKLFCFAFDWLGRALAIDLREGSGRQVVMVDPGGGDVLESEMPLLDFHESAMVSDDPLARPFYEEWLGSQSDVDRLSPDECAGYRVPLFLGGEDEADNLELIPLDVYWSISTQLYQGVRKMKPGTTIREIYISGED